LALTRHKKPSTSMTLSNDPRFDSVVVIYNPQGSSGTGFFVRPNLVLTNYHVVEDSKFVEIKFHSGLEILGKVIDSDVRLDLALIRTDSKGQPVTFYQSENIKLGSTVEAIGHPEGFEYSLTRGIISALRLRKSVYGIGRSNILFIQTDAAINMGNSGGPLMIGNEVVGMNNWKLVGDAENMGFAIHFSEILGFLNKTLNNTD